jgi:hypothetical protein
LSTPSFQPTQAPVKTRLFHGVNVFAFVENRWKSGVHFAAAIAIRAGSKP